MLPLLIIVAEIQCQHHIPDQVPPRLGHGLGLGARSRSRGAHGEPTSRLIS